MPKLPVLATVQRSYRIVFDNFQPLWEISSRWVMAAGVAFVVSQLWLSSQTGERVDDGMMLPVAILAIAMFVVIVRWHRVIIQRLAPTATASNALNAGVIYFLGSMVLGAVAAIPAIGLTLVLMSLTHIAPYLGEFASEFLPMLIAAGVGVGLFAACRLSLVLPGGAIGDFGMTLRKSWQLTRGNGWRMFIGSALSSGPAYVVSEGIDRALDNMPAMSGSQSVLTIVLILSVALMAVATVIQASFLSYAYLFFAGASEGSDHIVQAPPALER
jgi:hypothetical protein